VGAGLGREPGSGYLAARVLLDAGELPQAEVQVPVEAAGPADPAEDLPAGQLVPGLGLGDGRPLGADLVGERVLIHEPGRLPAKSQPLTEERGYIGIGVALLRRCHVKPPLPM
jgi:hypothetical protein